MTETSRLLQLRITLQGIEPETWRRVIVAPTLTLAGLHRVIQASMAWQDYHLHEFQHNGKRYGIPDDDDPETIADRTMRASRVLKSAGDVLPYVYDFGAGWEHSILLEDRPPAEEFPRTPVCIAGERAAPPEDCGGPYGYMDFLAALTGKNRRKRKEALEALGVDFSPEYFDIDEVKRRLRGRTRRMSY